LQRIAEDMGRVAADEARAAGCKLTAWRDGKLVEVSPANGDVVSQNDEESEALGELEDVLDGARGGLTITAA